MGKYEDYLQSLQNENQKRTGKKNFSDTYDPSKIEVRPSASPSLSPANSTQSPYQNYAYAAVNDSIKRKLDKMKTESGGSEP